MSERRRLELDSDRDAIIARVASGAGRTPREVEQALALADSGRVDLIESYQAGRLSLDTALRLARKNSSAPRVRAPTALPALTAPALTSSSHERLQMVEPKLKTVADAAAAEAVPIAKPSAFSLDKFRSKADPAPANVAELLTALPHYPIAGAKDFSRLHPDEKTFWTPELCFVNVPIKGQKSDTLHLIEEELALRFLDSGVIQRFRLALASKPHDVFYLCHVPTRNLDNTWNETNVQACEQSKTAWVQATSRKGENVEGYKIKFARDQDAFPEPKWPAQPLANLIEVSFAGRMIEVEDHPGLLRLIGAKQTLA
jgi:hypothetical protein